MDLTVAYLQRLGVCWTKSKLDEAARSWPTPMTWAWFLGARLAGLEFAEWMQRLHVALAHVMFQRVHGTDIRLPITPGELTALCKSCSDAHVSDHVLDMLEHLGTLLDGEPDAFATLEASITAARAALAPPAPGPTP